MMVLPVAVSLKKENQLVNKRWDRRGGYGRNTYAHHVLCLDSSILAWPP